MRDYPLPSYAASIWLAGDRLMLALPPIGSARQGNTIELPLSKFTPADGVAGAAIGILLSILHERSHVTSGGIATKSAPVQYDIEQLLKAARRVAPTAPAQPTELTEADLDLS